MKTINLNTVASTLFAGNTKIRVRTVDGVMQIRPTNRVLASNLPAGEMLRSMSFKTRKAKDAPAPVVELTVAEGTESVDASRDFEAPAPVKVTGAVFRLPADSAVEAGSKFEVVAGKYGWFVLAPVTDAPKTGAALASVSA